MSKRRVLRPMGYGELINEAFDLYKSNFLLFFGIGALLYVAEGVLEALVVRDAALKDWLSNSSLALPAIASVPILKAATERYLGKAASITGAWRFTLRRFFPLLLTSLAALLLVLGGTVLLLVPGMIASLWVFFLWNVMVAEERYYAGALRRSRELAAGQWTRIFVLSLLALALTFLAVTCVATLGVGIEALIEALVHAVTGSGAGLAPSSSQKPLAAELFDQVLGAAMLGLATPVPALLTTLLYFDVRVRKEGLDVELLAQEVASTQMPKEQT